MFHTLIIPYENSNLVDFFSLYFLLIVHVVAFVYAMLSINHLFMNNNLSFQKHVFYKALSLTLSWKN